MKAETPKGKPEPAATKVVTLSEEKVKKINERANAVFKSHTDVKKVYATIDGQVFLLKEKNSAENHARKLKQAELIVVEKGTELAIDEAALEVEKAAKEEAEKNKAQAEEEKLKTIVLNIEKLITEEKAAEALELAKTLTDEQKATLSDDVKLALEIAAEKK